ncbi:MAG: phasin family protein [Thermoanaerobaculia bacterium]
MTGKVKQLASGVAKSGVRAAEEYAFSFGRTAWLAGLGLVATAGEAGVATFEALVEKGRRRRESPVERAQRAVAEAGNEAVELAQDAARVVIREASGLLGRFGVPTGREIRALRARVDESVRTLRAQIG